MSWVAVVVGPSASALAGLRANYAARLKNPRFRPCSYCKRPADRDQKEAQCVSCGAALEEWEKTDL